MDDMYPRLVYGAVSFMFLKYWASAVTNRKLFSQLCRIYMVSMVVCIGFGSWMIAVLLLMFKDVGRWDVDFQLATIFPFYICINIFTWPYLIVAFYYTLDISYWMDELVNANGDIDEENPPPDTIDLSDVNLNQILMLVFAFPCLITVQIMDLIVALYKAPNQICEDSEEADAGSGNKRVCGKQRRKRREKGRSSVCDRIKRTVRGAGNKCVVVGKGRRRLARVPPPLD